MEDVPGALARFLSITAELKANVLHIYHHRSGRDLPVNLSRVELELETRGVGHVEQIIDELQRRGYAISQ